MGRFAAVFLVCAISCSSPKGEVVEPTPSGKQDALAARLTTYISSYGAHRGDGYKFSGYVHIVKSGETLYSQAFGVADRANEAPNSPDTSFRIGSVTKQFTAVAIYRLEQDGKLQLSDSIRKHLPTYPKPMGDLVTIHHMLTHTSGLWEYTRDAELMARSHEPHSIEQLINTFGNKPLQFTPGERFEYNNSGYIVLTAIIEAASGLSYSEYMRKHVFAPAGLESTVVGDADGAPDRAIGYQSDKSGELVLAPRIDMSVPSGGGAIRSTSRDLVRWHKALSSSVLLGPQSMERMLQPTDVSTTDSRATREGYAAGQKVIRDKTLKKTIIRHGGTIPGFSTTFFRVPEDDLAIVVWSNNGSLDTRPIAAAMLTGVYGKAIEPHVEGPIVSLSPAALEQLVGRYKATASAQAAALDTGMPRRFIDWTKSIEVLAADGSIKVKMADGEALLFNAQSKSVFDQLSIRLDFHFASDGERSQATGLRVSRGAHKLDLVRVEMNRP